MQIERRKSKTIPLLQMGHLFIRAILKSSLNKRLELWSLISLQSTLDINNLKMVLKELGCCSESEAKMGLMSPGSCLWRKPLALRPLKVFREITQTSQRWVPSSNPNREGLWAPSLLVSHTDFHLVSLMLASTKHFGSINLRNCSCVSCWFLFSGEPRKHTSETALRIHNTSRVESQRTELGVDSKISTKSQRTLLAKTALKIKNSTRGFASFHFEVYCHRHSAVER